MENMPKTPDTTEYSWQERALKAESQVTNLLDEMEYLRAQIRLLTQKRFGSSSEKATYDDQMKLFDAFNEAEANAEPFAPEPDLITVPEHKRAKRKGKKGLSLEDLPETTIEYRLSDEEVVCSCGHERHVIGQDVTNEIVVVPAELLVHKHVQYVYGCRHCENHGDGSKPAVVRAPKPNRAFPGSIASPSAVAYVIEQKHVMHVPLYRQEQWWEKRGVNLSRQNMSNWIMQAANVWLQPIYERMKDLLLTEDIIHADETSLQVLKEDGKKAQSKSYMWLYRSGRYGPGIVLYEYQPSRAKEHPAEFLKGFKGYLATDAYAGYKGLPDVVNVGCWSHAKRGFDDTVKAIGKRGKDSKAMEGLRFCRELFAIEKKLKKLDPNKRYEERLLYSKPVLEAFWAWLHETKELCPPKSHLGQAIQYCLNHWEALNAFLLDGRLEIDNNRSERSIKPFVIGRKNFLFCITPRGARASAITYSIIESAKENGLKPFDYLEYLFTELPNAKADELDRFLPWSDEIPEHCRTPKKK